MLLRKRDQQALRGLCLAASLALVACGGDEGSQVTGAAMGAPAATDSKGGAVNAPPEIASVALEPANPKPGAQLRARVEVSDPDGDTVELAYEWRVDGRVARSSGATHHVEGGGSHIEVQVVASDPHGGRAEAQAGVGIGNQAPVLQGIVFRPLGTVSVSHDLIAEPRAHDPEGDEIEFEYRWFVNDRELPETGPELATSNFARGDEVAVAVVASDGRIRSPELRSAPVEVVNAPPQIRSTPGTFDEDGVFRYLVEAVDPDGDTELRIEITGGPPDLEFDPRTGALVWDPTHGEASSHQVEIAVHDPHGGRASQAFRLSLDPDAGPAAQQR